jgi:hypothetical protein
MRWAIAGVLGYLAVGFLGLLIDDWQSFRRLQPAKALTCVLFAAKGALVSKNEAYRILKTMVSCARAEQNERGFRIHRGIVQHAIYVQEYMARQVRRLGIGGVA